MRLDRKVGIVTGSAILGLNPSTLRGRIKKLDIKRNKLVL